MCFGGMFELYVQFQIFETWKLGISKSFLSHPNPYISVTLHFQFINKFYWLYLLKSFRFPPSHCIHSVAKSYHLSPERVIWSPCFQTRLRQCVLQTEAVWFFFFFFKSRWYLKATKVLQKLIFCLSAPSLSQSLPIFPALATLEHELPIGRKVFSLVLSCIFSPKKYTWCTLVAQ